MVEANPGANDQVQQQQSHTVEINSPQDSMGPINNQQQQPQQFNTPGQQNDGNMDRQMFGGDGQGMDNQAQS